MSADPSESAHAPLSPLSAPGLSRRRVVQGGLVATLLAHVAGARAEDAGETSRPASLSTPAAAEPPQLTPAPVSGAQRLRAAEASWPLKPSGDATRLWCFEETSPGPLLRVRKGEELAVMLENGISQPITLHWHGLRLPNRLDGVGGLTEEPLAPGASREIRFAPRDAGTYWYRSMVPALAAEQTERGLYGVLVVEEDEPPPVDADLVIVLDDWALADDGQIAPGFGTAEEIGTVGRLGNWLTVNSEPPPESFSVAPGGRVRLRLLNAANARPISLRFDQLAVEVIALDGQPAEPFTPARNSLALLPGNRADLIITCAPEAGVSGHVVAVLGPGLPLLTIKTDGAPAPSANAADIKPPGNGLPETIDLAAALRVDVVLEGGLPPNTPPPVDVSRIWRINGVAFTDAVAPLFSTGQGKPVVLSLVNKTEMLQALHLHGHTARLLHALDDGWEPYWQDTLAVPAGRTVRIAFITEGAGQWMISSAILDRLGGGMATWFTVT
ncbi:multicopper oxidase family protein [Chelatococcus asaccharovorans]|uniref:multicopper oxidase family protein n=1 Tax=Chelatococcus asaccharovorans TaxID=28210 RepID=UPI00224C7A10|nr:multicopper oxidase family protein [Chelatococcus asaccharovorans]CAH1670401.1 Multicopper oxidase [Chelatococcus asaccharovorans]CAH1678168.1 Multicopper oxidase [Chelatococcus asaccharovorans]